MKSSSPIDQIRSSVRKMLGALARGLDKVSGGRITPNSITYTSLLGHVPIAYLIATGEFFWAGGLLIIFGLMDTLDGEVARLQNRASSRGMFLDSVTDRVKEVMLYIGVGFYFVSELDPYYAVWAIAACGIAVIVSYLNAWGEVVTADLPKETHAKNKAFRTGFMTYDVRIFFIVLGLFTGWLDVAVITVAVLSAITALQRFNNVYKRLS
jgi:CDP-diacylglycerol--glycerol-3-phosphate 3-phosphatidyltransferase